MPALPTTNLTLHVDASDTDHIWKNNLGSSPWGSGVPADGDTVSVWDDETNTLKLMVDTAGREPNWRSVSPLMALPCLDFSDDYMPLFIPGVAGQPLSAVISASAYVAVLSIYIEGGATNSGTPQNNDAIWEDFGLFAGLHVKNNAGAFSLTPYNNDGTADSFDMSVNVATNYVVVTWHTGGTLFGEVYDYATGLVASGSVASGNTSTLTNQFQVGRGASGVYYNGRIGEAAFYNAYNATDKADAVQYFRDKWLVAPTSTARVQAITF